MMETSPDFWADYCFKTCRSEGMEQQIREEAVELDHDAGGDAEPDGSKHRSRGEELFHGWMGVRWVKVKRSNPVDSTG